MSSTTIRYGASEFAAYDLPIEVWLLVVADQIGAPACPWLKSLKEEWRLQATAGFGFGPSPALDRFVDSDQRREVLAAIFVKSIEALSSRREPFSPSELDDMGVGGSDTTHSGELSVENVIGVGRQFLTLIADGIAEQRPASE